MEKPILHGMCITPYIRTIKHYEDNYDHKNISRNRYIDTINFYPFNKFGKHKFILKLHKHNFRYINSIMKIIEISNTFNNGRDRCIPPFKTDLQFYDYLRKYYNGYLIPYYNPQNNYTEKIKIFSCEKLLDLCDDYKEYSVFSHNYPNIPINVITGFHAKIVIPTDKTDIEEDDNSYYEKLFMEALIFYKKDKKIFTADILECLYNKYCSNLKSNSYDSIYYKIIHYKTNFEKKIDTVNPTPIYFSLGIGMKDITVNFYNIPIEWIFELPLFINHYNFIKEHIKWEENKTTESIDIEPDKVTIKLSDMFTLNFSLKEEENYCILHKNFIVENKSKDWLKKLFPEFTNEIYDIILNEKFHKIFEYKIHTHYKYNYIVLFINENFDLSHLKVLFKDEDLNKIESYKHETVGYRNMILHISKFKINISGNYDNDHYKSNIDEYYISVARRYFTM